MKNIAARPFKVSGESFVLWLIGAACGILLTLSLALGTGRLDLTRTNNAPPAVVVQQAPAVTGDGLVPPPIDEFQQYQSQMAALRASIGLVPPPVDEIQQYRHAEAIARAAAESAPPPIDEVQRYHRQLAHLLDNSAPPMPETAGTRY